MHLSASPAYADAAVIRFPVLASTVRLKFLIPSVTPPYYGRVNEGMIIVFRIKDIQHSRWLGHRGNWKLSRRLEWCQGRACYRMPRPGIRIWKTWMFMFWNARTFTGPLVPTASWGGTPAVVITELLRDIEGNGSSEGVAELAFSNFLKYGRSESQFQGPSPSDKRPQASYSALEARSNTV